LKDEIVETILIKKNLQNKKKATKRMRIQFERKTPKEDEI
jgi:hypothetical protein